MITYYVAQFLIGKGAFYVGVYFTEEKRQTIGSHEDVATHKHHNIERQMWFYQPFKVHN